MSNIKLIHQSNPIKQNSEEEINYLVTISGPPTVGERKTLCGVLAIDQLAITLLIARLVELHTQLVIDGERTAPDSDFDTNTHLFTQ